MGGSSPRCTKPKPPWNASLQYTLPEEKNKKELEMDGKWKMKKPLLVSQLSSSFSSLFTLKRPVCLAVFFGGRNGLISMDVNGGMVAGVFVNWMVVSLFFHGEQSQNCPMLGTPCRLSPLWNSSTSSPPPSNSPSTNSTKMRQEQRWVRDPERHQSSKCNRE